MYTVELFIIGQRWKVHLLDEKKYIRKWGDDSAALTAHTTYNMYFNEAELSLEVVLHEYFHAAMASMCITAAKLKPHQVEEVAADVFAQHGKSILKQGKKLYKEMVYEKEN